MSLFQGNLNPYERGQAARGQEGGAIALVIIFLPVALMSMGIVADLGMLFTAKRLVQAACDFGALAGCQELDWDLLAQGTVFIDETYGAARAVEYAERNLQGVESLFQEISVGAAVDNEKEDGPAVFVCANVAVRTYFLRWMPGMAEGIFLKIASESSVVQRTRW